VKDLGTILLDLLHAGFAESMTKDLCQNKTTARQNDKAAVSNKQHETNYAK